MQMAIKQAKRQHVVAIPYPAQGHINPMLQLCQQLAPFGFTFTFVNTHHIHQRVQSARRTYDAHLDIGHGMNTHADGLAPDQYCSIRMVCVAGGQPPEKHAHQSSRFEALQAAEEMRVPVEELLLQIMQEHEVSFILSDVMLGGWSGTTAGKFSLPWIAFWPGSAASCSALMHFADLAAEGKGIPMAENEEAAGDFAILEGIPGLPPTHLYELPKVWDSSTWEVKNPVLSSFSAVKEASCLVLNTLEELEGQVLEALRKRVSTVALGPLLPLHYLLPSPCPDICMQQPSLSLFPEDTSCLAWLDTQAASSVLFISFGSISLRSEQQLHELALGVEASGCPFLWVRRPALGQGDQDGRHVFTQVNGHPYGLVVPWAPQLQVLSHPSVGGFITHCGWNSIIESVSMGVPMICWADTGERMSNQRFVVEFWKCGVNMVSTDSKRIKQNIDEAVLVERDEVESSVRFLMFEEAGAPIRARAAQLRTIATNAFQEAQAHFGNFVQAMEQKLSSLTNMIRQAL